MDATTAKTQRRRILRQPANFSVIRVEIKDGAGQSCWETANLVDVIPSGCGLALMTLLPSGSTVGVRGNLDGRSGAEHRKAGVRWCVRRSDGTFRAGLEFLEGMSPEPCKPRDVYEVMQLSPSADAETISRVYRLLAFRYHPDNQATGNAERFLGLSEAYEILSDPEKRASYDARHARVRPACATHPYQVSTCSTLEAATQAHFEEVAAAYLGLCLGYPRHALCWEA